MMLKNEVWSGLRLALTALAGTRLCSCSVAVLSKHCPTRVHVHVYILRGVHRAGLCFSRVRTVSTCGLVGFSNTHALCLPYAQRPPVV